MPSILVVDPAKEVQEALSSVLTPMGLDVKLLSDCDKAVDTCIKHKIEIVMADTGSGGIALVERLRQKGTDTLVIVTDAVPSKANAIRALRGGAFDYLRKPLRVAEFVEAINRGLDSKRLQLDHEHKARSGTIAKQSWEDFLPLVGNTDSVVRLREMLEKLEKSKRLPPILIQGELGSGKTQLAEAIHHICQGGDKPIVFFNCTDKPITEQREEILGDGTGGLLFDKARNGALVLENITQLDQAVQSQLPKLPNELLSSVMFICTCEVNLEEAMLSGEASTELCYYLMDTVLEVPALRDRMVDLKLLVNHILQTSLALSDKARKVEFSEEIYDLMRAFDWPNNLIGLEQFIIYCASKSQLKGDKVTLEIAKRGLQLLQGQSV